ncbi:unnamed protein product, partial [Owenia fusiformis]
HYVDMEKVNALMGIKTGDKILTIAANGAHALSKLLADPAEVIALDASAPQLHMAKLQASAMKLLSREEFCTLIGIDRMRIPSEERIKMYRDIRSSLESETMAYWDAFTKDIGEGFLYCGEYENGYTNLLKDMIPSIHDKATVEEFLALGDNMEEQIRYYEDIWSTSQWCAVYKGMARNAFFSRASTALNIDFSTLSTYLLNQFEKMIRHTPNKRNEFLEAFLTGDINGSCKLHAYLREGNFEFIKSRLDRMKWIEGDIIEFVRDRAAKQNFERLDGINLSTVPVYYKKFPDKIYNLMKQAVEICKPGSKLVYYAAYEELNNQFPQKMIEDGVLTYNGQDLSCGILIPRYATVN